MMEMVPGNTQYNMAWWRRCENDHRQMYEKLKEHLYKQRTKSIPVAGT